ncbi:MAG: flagellar filament outer layer protein FlaA [Spirochaetaceae bacterium]|jgi:hypothetical protein|nr:flagellar filament outer layer protein FlaA [Spirochaetaceae bacterium]
MKKFLFFLFAAMVIGSWAIVADESTLIDFTLLDADPDKTEMDYSVAAGASFTDEQKGLMKTNLALPNWEVVLNNSAHNAEAVANSGVKSAKVKDSVQSTIGSSAAGKTVMGVRVRFPESAVNANARIIPPFEIPAYEGYDGSENAKTKFEDGYGVVKNVGTIKSMKVTVFGNSYPHGLYVILKDTDGIERRYFMGYLNFDGWKVLEWVNPHYMVNVRDRELRPYPVYPRGLPFVKFVGFQITRDAGDAGGDFISYFKDVSITYDLAVLSRERDIADEDLWGIIKQKEDARQRREVQRFGALQVERFIEQEKMHKEPEEQ